MQPATTIDTGEHRSHQRFPFWIDVTLEGDIGEAVTAATLIDLSASGALVRLAPDRESEGHGRIRFTSGPELRAVAYNVVAVEESWEGTLLHVMFAGVDQDDEAHLGRLLAERESESTDMQRWIASGHGLLGRVQEHANRRVLTPGALAGRGLHSVCVHCGRRRHIHRHRRTALGVADRAGGRAVPGPLGARGRTPARG